MTIKHDSWCSLVNPANASMGKHNRCNCNAGIDQSPKTWYVEIKVRKKWKRIDEFKNTSQRDAEQLFFRKHFGQGRLISANGLITITVPHGEEKES